MQTIKLRIAEKIATDRGAMALFTGDNLGQVASQTMSALAVTDDAVNMPVFRPLIGMDKNDIINIAKKIGTYETSILPYEDCCTVFVPKHPVIKPAINEIIEEENKCELDDLIQEAFDKREVKQFLVRDFVEENFSKK